jgi:hypothetical protein
VDGVASDPHLGSEDHRDDHLARHLVGPIGDHSDESDESDESGDHPDIGARDCDVATVVERFARSRLGVGRGGEPGRSGDHADHRPSG